MKDLPPFDPHRSAHDAGDTVYRPERRRPVPTTHRPRPPLQSYDGDDVRHGQRFSLEPQHRPPRFPEYEPPRDVTQRYPPMRDGRRPVRYGPVVYHTPPPSFPPYRRSTAYKSGDDADDVSAQERRHPSHFPALSDDERLPNDDVIYMVVSMPKKFMMGKDVFHPTEDMEKGVKIIGYHDEDGQYRPFDSSI